jgi:uncharacterized protein
MDMTGVQRIEAPREIVWAALNDIELLRQCIPGCEDLKQVSDNEFRAKITLKLGTIKTTFTGKLALSDIEAINSYSITGSGSGGLAGFVSGRADVQLAPEGESTVLSYKLKAALGGRLALGARMVDTTAKRLAGEFFSKLGEAVQQKASDSGPTTAGGYRASHQPDVL